MERSSKVKHKCLKGALCLRCKRNYQLECHHIVALQDGGLDVLENTAPLCHWCHKEWHKHHDPMTPNNQIEWRRFLKSDPHHIGVAMADFMTRRPDMASEMSAKELYETAKEAWDQYVSLRNSGFSLDFIDELAQS